MPLPILGIHHVTSLAAGPQRNLSFWTGTMGLRLVKKTVNFDDPETYHLYFGDAAGRPGSLMTTFPHPRARRRSPGAPEVGRTVFAVPPGSLGFWQSRLAAHKIPATLNDGPPATLDFEDPDGTSLALIEADADRGYAPASGGDIPADHAIRCVDRVSLRVAQAAPTESFLREVMGFRPAGTSGRAAVYEVGDGGASRRLEVLEDAGGARRLMGAGTVHHVAFRVAGDDEQAACLSELQRLGFGPTPVQDRQYFRSIYFREPGGVIFEIATDPPGMDLDEAPEALGESLRLPPWLEPRRSAIESGLIPLGRDL